MNETDIRLVEEKNAEPHKEKVKKGRYLCEEDRIVKAKRNHRNKRIRMMCITVVSILLVLIMGLCAMRNKLILSGGDGDNYLSYVFTKK